MSVVAQISNLERLTQGGMRFANFYAPSSRCILSRAVLLTCKSPAQLHMTFVGKGKQNAADLAPRLIAPQATMELPAEETIISERLKSQQRGF